MTYFLIAHKAAVGGSVSERPPLWRRPEDPLLTHCRVIGGGVVLASQEGVW